MNKASLTRRELVCATAAGQALGAQAGEQTVKVSNAALEFRTEVRGGRPVRRQFVNKLANETVDLPLEEFALEFDDGTVARSADAPARWQQSPGSIESLHRFNGGVSVRVCYELVKDKPYLRKRIWVQAPHLKPVRLIRATLENWQGVRRQWRSMSGKDRYPYGSHPIYCESLWAGVEFAAAFNSFSNDGFLLASRPGAPLVGSQELPLNTTVIGVAEPLKVRDAFLAYIDDIRLAPPRIVACYNTWWTYFARDISREPYLAIIREMKEKLADRHGIFFDYVTTDEGWADKTTVWKIDRKKLPDGFADVRALVESAGAKLGLWISPSAVYPNSTDCDLAAAGGYVIVENDYRANTRHPGLSLADPKYLDQTKAQLATLIREANLHQVKFDGMIARERRPHHDMQGGEDSVEPLARRSFELIASTIKANPNLFTEPTYLNSLANYISPWIIQHAHSVWGNSGGDCPRGINPAPDYRESHTNAREFFIFSSLNEVWLPQNALQYFDIVHCDPDAGLPNHAAMAFGRGRAFVATYVNPKFMSALDWEIYAGLLRWARTNEPVLMNTRVTPSRVELGEPYVYAHWLGMRGILAVRNPSNITREYVVDLERDGAPMGLADAVCFAQYPGRRGIAAALSAKSRVKLTMAPWELVFLEIVPRAELTEPVAVGARWTVDANGAGLAVPDPDTAELRLYLPKGGERTIPVTPRRWGTLAGEVTGYSKRLVGEAAWLLRNGKPAPTAGFEIACTVTIPAGARGKALLLVQFPGMEHRANRCSATVNGQPVTLRESSSVGRIGNQGGVLPRWKEVVPHMSEWSWHMADLEAGVSNVRLTGAAADPECRIGLWAWSEEDLRPVAVPLGVDCPLPALPPYRAHIERRGICLRQPA